MKNYIYTKKKERIIGIIPARFHSSRFPGKPLVLIQGKPMIQWVYEAASTILPKVYIATEDIRIVKAAQKFNATTILTSKNCENGTIRCIEAFNQLKKNEGNVDLVINIQGDEPFISSDALLQLLKAFEDPQTDIATLISPICNRNILLNKNVVKVVFRKDHFALYFSRSPIPYIMHQSGTNNILKKNCYFKHIGLYGFRSTILQRIGLLTPTPLEKAESLEQNRWLEHGLAIKLMLTSYDGSAIDTPEDLEKLLRK